MAVFFNHGVQGPSKLTNSSPHLLEWHSSRPLLAVASKDEAADADGAVHIYSNKVRVHLLTCSAYCREACFRMEALYLIPGNYNKLLSKRLFSVCSILTLHVG